jgi:fibronectin-binding autotransporter adhesin
MKLRTALLFAAALVSSQSLTAGTYTWTGAAVTNSGQWNETNTANWNGVTPIFDNTADLIFGGTTPITTFGTWLGGADRTVRSLTFSSFSTQLEIRTNNNSTTARQLRFAADSGNATITMNSTVTAPVVIGAVAGNSPTFSDNGTIRLDSNLSVVQNSGSLLSMRRPISESGGARSITKSGTGVLLLSAANTYTGNVTINAGTLRISNATALGTGTKSITVASGATLDIAGALDLGTGNTITVSGSGAGGLGALYCSTGNQGTALAAQNGLILAGNTTVGGASGTRFGAGANLGTGTTTGLHTLTKVGAGQFDLRGSITIGNVVVSEGVFQTQRATWNDDDYTLSLSPGTEFRLFEIISPFPRDITLNNATISSTNSPDFVGDTLTGNVTLTGACTLSSAGGDNDFLTLSGNLIESAPSASVTIGGTRKIVLAGTNTYTGTTTVGDGVNTPTLQVDGSLTSNIAVAGLATLGGDGVTTGTITLANLSRITFDPSTTGTNQFLRSADVIIGASDVISVSPMKPGTGVPAIVLQDGSGGLNLANFALLNPGRAVLSLGGTGGNSDLIYTPNNASLEWRNFSTDGIWGVEDLADNFQNLGTSSPDDFFLNDNVSFTDAATGTVTLAANIIAGNISLNNTTGNNLTINPTATETISSFGLSTTSSGNATIAAQITGNTPITVGGSGTLTLTADNTTTSTVTINSGTLQLGNGGATGSVGRPITNNGALVVSRDSSAIIILNQVISGNGTLTQAGAGTTALSTAHTYTGLTTISSGSLEFYAAGSIPGNILNNAKLSLSGTTNKTFANNVSGTGFLEKRGTHALTLTGTNTFQDGIVLENGNLTAGSTNIGSGEITFLGNANTNRWFITDGSVIANDILFASGATNTKLIDVATPTSHVELAGTITFAADLPTPTPPATSGPGTSRIGPVGGTIVVSGKMTGTGTGGYAKRNTGTVVITNATNDYTGPTTIIDGGSLLVNAPGVIPGNVFFGQNLDGSSTTAATGTLGGSGSITGNVTTQATSNLSPGGTSSAGVNTNTAATLTINGNLDISLSAADVGLIRMDLNAPAGTNDRINAASATIGTNALGLTDFAFNNLGGLAAGTYTLISTTSGITGTLNPADLTGEIAPGFNGTLAISGNNITLAVTSTGSPYDTWIATFGLTGPNAAFDFDHDNDGIDNGLEWVLGGNPTIGDTASLYTVTGSAASGLTLSFDREEDSIGVATLSVEYGTTLATWPGSATIGATSSGPDGNGVVVTVNAVPNPDEVTVNIPASNSASGKLFARLKATRP